ncbi:Probable glutamate racemase MurI [Mycobacteroides abscessus]|nr:Probable glutamate racemase MurI [Mycobacteroides abscessus]
MSDAPIGIFDSGVGGLTVARAIIDQLPDEDILYVGDTGNGPYGPLTIPEIRKHALTIGDDLVGRGVKALVIACNTASAACLRDARERYAPVPVIEVVLPAVRRAVHTTHNNKIGVIGTEATIASGAYQDASPPRATPRSPRWHVHDSSISSSAALPVGGRYFSSRRAIWSHCNEPRWTPWCWVVPTIRCCLG